VIQLEDQQQQKYSGENLIMATMVQSTHMKDSEEFAGIIQNELASGINSKNRGVKQAGFYVLIGASMPNVLIEVGFLSNPTEEKKLKKASYRQQIAEAVYSAIFKFRNTKEKLLAKG
jgi:N-acetylmuramoyl-L-alanine amidase